MASDTINKCENLNSNDEQSGEEINSTVKMPVVMEKAKLTETGYVGIKQVTSETITKTTDSASNDIGASNLVVKTECKNDTVLEAVVNQKNLRNLSSQIKVESSDNLKSERTTTNDTAITTVFKTEKILDISETKVLEDKESKSDICSTTTILPVKPRRKRGQIYNKNDDPETIKEKRKKRAVELKLKNLKWTLNQDEQQISSRKREKKAPQRFEICPTKKRKSCLDNCHGNGDQLGTIPWIVQQLRDASLYTLRLLHRVIYRKQGMFSDKHIRKSVSTFSGFPFDARSPELSKRRDQLDKANVNALSSLCNLLGIKGGSKEDMIDKIIGFLMCPSADIVDDFLREIAQDKMMQQKQFFARKMLASPQVGFGGVLPESGIISHEEAAMDINNDDWKPPLYFMEGTGVKLKYIRAVLSNINVASESIIELLHRLLYVRLDEKCKMRRNILEFSGFRFMTGSSDYMARARVLAPMPVEQIKLLCRVLCLPTWHRSRQLLTEGIMDFLQVPRISAMKKRVPPHFSDEITFSFDGAQKSQIPELKSVETEEIEIVPDIIMPDDNSTILGYEFGMENDYIGVKLKNFSNIHYQVISTPAAKLNDVHMVLYLKPCPPNNIRKNVLEFSGYPFDEFSPEYQCRRAFMEQMSIEDLKGVATVLCVSQYIVDESKNSLIEAIMKFLLKPSALLNSSTIMPTISPAPCDVTQSFVVKKKATSTSKNPDPKNISVKRKRQENQKVAKMASNTTNVSCSSAISPEAEKFVSALNLPPDIVIKEVYSMNPAVTGHDADEPLSNVKKEVSIVPVRVPYLGSDDDDEQPLSKMVGHPNDDQLRLLIAKIMKESKLEDITMKHVIQRVFETYSNFDLTYRKDFIKSIVRQILSQMDDQSCSVSTTVIAI